ncbi:MAG: class I SAM-dependent methyltransferase [Kiloniellaceae bacterium]
MEQTFTQSESDRSRVARERDFHNSRFEHDDRDAQLKYYDAIGDCFRAYGARVQELAVDADILEYGCGYGDNALRLAPRARTACGIDISDVAIARGGQRAADNGLTNVRLEAMNAEAMTFPDDTFDLVFGSGILHHLDVERAFAEINRVLRPGGRAVFVEPLGHNPAIELYRRLTPGARTPDEHPLLKSDFDRFDAVFGATDCRFYGLTTLVAVPFRNSRAKAPLLAVTRSIDKALFALPACRWWAWYALMEATKAAKA